MKKEVCFISHCSDDRKILDSLHAVLREGYDRERYRFFDTSREEYSTKAGGYLSPSLMEPLQEAGVMIAVITDSYVRSVFCLAEICAFWLMGKPVIPLVYSQAGVRLLEENLQGIIYIDLLRPERNADDMARKTVSSLAGYGFVSSDPDRVAGAFARMFASVPQAKPLRPYIGSGDTYEYINRYCEDSGIIRFKNTSLTPGELSAALSGYEEIYVVATTGSGLVGALASRFIPDAIERGVRFCFLIPNRCSDYINDVAEAEAPPPPENHPDPEKQRESDEHRDRFAREFDSVIYNLKECLRRSKPAGPESAGRIFVGCAGSLLRQTVILAKKDDRLWGWLSVTMPPGRTVDGTPSFSFSGTTGQPGLASVAYRHVLSIRDYAVRHGNYHELTAHSGFSSFYPENQAAEAYWQDLYSRAKQNTLGRDGDTDLIEVAAQHPLRPNGTPGPEFRKRLDRAAALYDELIKDGRQAKIYVPGSLHCCKGKADPCSLSDAGVAYLLEKGIPGEDLLGDEENVRYKGDLGVYNTADECFVASQIFLEGDYRRLHCVCSPSQLLRKKLFHIVFGVIPFYHTVNVENPAHDDIYELFHALPDVLCHDHTWQGETSVNGNRTRQERDPRYARERRP